MSNINVIDYSYGSVGGSGLNSFYPLPVGGQTNGGVWSTTTSASTSVDLPPWINDDMLDDIQAKKLYTYISGEEVGDTPLPSAGKPIPDFKPKHSVVMKVLGELGGLRGANLFRGGTDAEWVEIKKLAEKWHDLAVMGGAIGKQFRIVRADRSYVERNYSFIAKAWTFRRHGKRYLQTGDIAIDAYEVVKDAIRELSEKKPSLAVIEYEMLKAGGMILGISAMHGESTLVVFYDSIGKSVMDRLMSDGVKRRKPPRTKRMVQGFGASGGNGGSGGGIGVNGAGAGGDWIGI